MSNQVVVVGAGISGLVSALTLAELGTCVTVVELAPHVAPLLRGFSRGEHDCDVGLHYTGGLNVGGLLHALLTRFGVVEDLTFQSLDENGFDHLVWPRKDFELVIPTGLAEVSETLHRAFPGSSEAIEAFFSFVGQFLRETPLLNPAIPLQNTVNAGIARQARRVSLEVFLAEHGADRLLIEVLGRYGRLLCGLGASEIPLATSAGVLGSYFLSVHQIRGGGKALVACLEERCRELGVVVRCRSTVQRISLGLNGSVAGVLLDDGSEIAAGTVIYTADPAQLPGLLSEPVASAYKERLKKIHSTAGALIVYLPAQHKNGSKRNTYVLDVVDVPGRDAGLRDAGVMAASFPDVGRRATISALMPMTLNDLADGQNISGSEPFVGYQERKASLAAELLKDVAPWLPTSASLDDVLEVLTPASFCKWSGSSTGSAYGLARSVNSPRLSPVTPVAGLFLAGQSLLMPGLMGASASGILACAHAMGFERVWRELFS